LDHRKNMSETTAPDSNFDTASQRKFPCSHCGASLEFAPGVDSLKCPYCSTVNQVPHVRIQVNAEDYRAALAECANQEPAHETLNVKCPNCGAQTTLKPDVVADKCPFCASPIVAEASSHRKIKPRALLPFHITRDQAIAQFRQWLSSLWFAPSKLKEQAAKGQINGLYLPAWTYDTDCTTSYTGMRGEDYWETETYTEMENGRPVTRTRQVVHTRWWPTAGTVANDFSDVLVMATDTLPEKYLAKLEPWDLTQQQSYADEFLAGFVAMSYDIDLHQGFDRAQQLIQPTIRQTICQHIGGDHQQILTANTTYDHITFKHLLLPVWLSAYQYAGKTYRFLVNARTGEVQGERPYSWVKIAILILVILVLMLFGWILMQH
jgi:LSD1 subclass zinc finger protein